ncbi:hypothetical protein NDU88_004200 [Pleurodeles waltl]|uniref:Reverse transcriptase domain-containing protein n=1 Tax=Pleurodeles waltl TaxID=8319 RepID=A0AAV7QBW8_PLEWA|nr:hypothetical protein NDU88_004200 [Pleurodeles waltl]
MMVIKLHPHFEAEAKPAPAAGLSFEMLGLAAKSQVLRPDGQTSRESGTRRGCRGQPSSPGLQKDQRNWKRKGPRQEQAKPDQGSTQALEPQSTEEEMPAMPESGPTDNAPQPASEIQEKGPWMKQECRKRRHCPPQATKKSRKKLLSNHNPYFDLWESEEEEQPENGGSDDQLDQVTKVLQEMRALASVMEASPPSSPAIVKKEEASIEEEEQSRPANLEEEEPETSQKCKPASEKHRAKTTVPTPETRQEPNQPLGPDLLELYEDMEQEGVMPHTLREGMIALLYKHKGERCDLKHWHPISLLNVDYKILAKTMVKRLNDAMGEIVHPDQTCGVPGRRVMDSLALIRDTIKYTTDRNIRAALVCLTQKKAFDRVSHEFMERVREGFGLGERFCNYVKIMYTDIFSSVMVKVWKTDPFPIRSRVRHGCPLLPSLFVLVIELLAEYIRKNRNIRGIPTPGDAKKEVKCTLYMDDVTLFARMGNRSRPCWRHARTLAKHQEQKCGQIIGKALRPLGPM